MRPRSAGACAPGGEAPSGRGRGGAFSAVVLSGVVAVATRTRERGKDLVRHLLHGDPVDAGLCSQELGGFFDRDTEACHERAFGLVHGSGEYEQGWLVHRRPVAGVLHGAARRRSDGKGQTDDPATLRVGYLLVDA